MKMSWNVTAWSLKMSALTLITREGVAFKWDKDPLDIVCSVQAKEMARELT